MSPEILTNLWALGGLLAVLALSFRLTEHAAFRWLSAPVMGLVLTAVLTNLGGLPTPAQTGVYDFIAGFGLQAAIFLVLLRINLRTLVRAGPSAIFYFLLGAGALWIGLLVTAVIPWIVQSLGAVYPSFAGIYAATYIGGSVNFNAVAAILGVARQGPDYAVAVAADSVMTLVWMVLSVMAAPILRRMWPQPFPTPVGDAPEVQPPTEPAAPVDLAIAGAAAVGTILLARWLSSVMPAIHPILWLTTLSLIAAQIPYLARLGGRLESLAIVVLYLFIASIGADVSVEAVVTQGLAAVASIVMIAIGFMVHGAILVAVARWRKGDADLVLVASQAGIGGPPTALALAEALGRPDLRATGVAMGLVGYAIGTYMGVAMARVVVGLLSP